MGSTHHRTTRHSLVRHKVHPYPAIKSGQPLNNFMFPSILAIAAMAVSSKRTWTFQSTIRSNHQKWNSFPRSGIRIVIRLASGFHFRIDHLTNTLHFFYQVDKNGDVCISILHEPGDDKYGYEKASERWLVSVLTIDQWSSPFFHCSTTRYRSCDYILP